MEDDYNYLVILKFKDGTENSHYIPTDMLASQIEDINNNISNFISIGNNLYNKDSIKWIEVIKKSKTLI